MVVSKVQDLSIADLGFRIESHKNLGIANLEI
jgi:hypothetical protein